MAPAQICRWHAFPSREALERAACAYILEAAAQAIGARGVFHIVLAGGDTPRPVYRALRDAATDWSAWHVYFGDERCLPADHAQRNSHMAAAAWLDHVPIPPQQIQAIPAERGAEAGAAEYAALLVDVGEFDLVLLGLGEDGHVASLFPGAPWEQAPALPDAIPVHGAPKPPPQRISLSPQRLSRAARVLFLVSGAGKRQAVAAWQAGAAIPARRITPPHGVDVFLALDNAPADDAPRLA